VAWAMSLSALDPSLPDAERQRRSVTCGFSIRLVRPGGAVPPSITDANFLVRGSVGDG
jgi:hypothetical protein